MTSAHLRNCFPEMCRNHGGDINAGLPKQGDPNIDPHIL